MYTLSMPHADLKKLLTVVKPALRKSALTILSHAKICVTPNDVTAIVYNGKSLSASINKAYTTESFEFLIHMDSIAQIVNAKATDVTFDIQAMVADKRSYNKITLSLDTLKFEIETDLAAEFWDGMRHYSEVVDSYSLPLDGQKLKAAIPFTNPKEEQRPALGHVALEFESSRYTIVATDAHSLYTTDVEHDIDHTPQPVYIPSTLLAAMPLVPPTKKSFISKYMAVSILQCPDHNERDRQYLTTLSYNLDGIIVVAAWIWNNRQFNGYNYPQWRVVVPTGYSILATVNRKQMIEASASLLPVTARSPWRVDFHFNGACDMSTNYEWAKSKSRLSIPANNSFQTESNELDISFDVKRWMALLKTFNDDYISIQLTDATKCAVVKQGGVMVLQMPLYLAHR